MCVYLSIKYIKVCACACACIKVSIQVSMCGFRAGLITKALCLYLSIRHGQQCSTVILKAWVDHVGQETIGMAARIWCLKMGPHDYHKDHEGGNRPLIPKELPLMPEMQKMERQGVATTEGVMGNKLRSCMDHMECMALDI